MLNLPAVSGIYCGSRARAVLAAALPDYGFSVPSVVASR
jgi:hypothetical protein